MTNAKYQRCTRALARFKLTASSDTKYRLGNERNTEPNLGDWLRAKMAERERLEHVIRNHSSARSKRQLRRLRKAA